LLSPKLVEELSFLGNGKVSGIAHVEKLLDVFDVLFHEVIKGPHFMGFPVCVLVEYLLFFNEPLPVLAELLAND